MPEFVGKGEAVTVALMPWKQQSMVPPEAKGGDGAGTCSSARDASSVDSSRQIKTGSPPDEGRPFVLGIPRISP
ncbi:hypothetical protein GCM10011608_16790 [Micromonospora sonchi]|uniref:Uncharacterized protein n=1 Tax=Micromonospora sonchi TaxID=1763543 RepID=A0A917WUA9_9ACTN|nr:hypothetical protein GCM10011608_16790 [Micromonospora sonchi]